MILAGAAFFARTGALGVMLMLLQPLAAGAFCREPYPPRVCAAFFANQIVFTGKVLSVKAVPPGVDGLEPEPDGNGGWIYRLRVIRSYRGRIGKTLRVSTENESDRYPVDAGKSYLLFAVQRPGDKMPGIYGCSLSAELSEAGPIISKIEEILHAKPGSGGHIGGGFEPTGDMRDLSGIRVTAEGGGKAFQAVTAKDGSWEVWVPAGTYNLQAKSPDWYISPSDWESLYPFKNIVIRDGGCADVELSGMYMVR